MLARVQQLQQNGIYAIVQIRDGNDLQQYRCSTDGYPFTGANNINGVDDGYTIGSMGETSENTAPPNQFTNYQVALMRKIVDTLNDQPNVIWEPAKESPAAGSGTAWLLYMVDQTKSYESGKPLQHPILLVRQNLAEASSDATLYNSNAHAVAPGSRFRERYANPIL
jgi:hypothetical protein